FPRPTRSSVASALPHSDQHSWLPILPSRRRASLSDRASRCRRSRQAGIPGHPLPEPEQEESMEHLGYTSVPALRKYLRQAERLGLDIDSALAAAGLSHDDLADNGRRIPGLVHERLLAHLLK